MKTGEVSKAAWRKPGGGNRGISGVAKKWLKKRWRQRSYRKMAASNKRQSALQRTLRLAHRAHALPAHAACCRTARRTRMAAASAAAWQHRHQAAMKNESGKQ
jgi:hypothetical protein